MVDNNTDLIRLKELITKGEFVDVNRGTWKGREKDLHVVVKSLVGGAPQDEKIKLLQEAVVMGQFHHPNILQFYGIVDEYNTVSDFVYHCIIILIVYWTYLNQTMLVIEYTNKSTLLNSLRMIKPE